MGKRLAWLEGIRIFAAVILLIYHAQLLFTTYAYTPQPTGIVENFRVMGEVTGRPDQSIEQKLILLSMGL